MDLIGKAEQTATMAHCGQYRRDGITHARDVASRVSSDAEKIVAFLHDTIEDTALTRSDLLDQGFPQFMVDAIVLLTKDDDTIYDDYILKISQNKLATNVKIADMLSNLSDNPSKKQTKKYAKSLQILINSL